MLYHQLDSKRASFTLRFRVVIVKVHLIVADVITERLVSNLVITTKGVIEGERLFHVGGGGLQSGCAEERGENACQCELAHDVRLF